MMYLLARDDLWGSNYSQCGEDVMVAERFGVNGGDNEV